MEDFQCFRHMHGAHGRWDDTLEHSEKSVHK